MQFLFRNYYDRTMHAAFFYDGTLNTEILKNAYMEVVRKVNVLHSTFHNNPVKPYWTINEEFSTDDFFSFTETAEPEKAFDKFITQEVSPYGKVQFRATVIRSGGKDIWAVVCNHMCFDGTDLRYFNMKVVESYNNFVSTNSYTVDVKSGTRNADQVYSKMSEEDKRHALKLYKNISTVSNKIVFPFALDDDTLRPRMILKKLPRETFLKMKARGKAMGATVNDVIVAGYFRALFNTVERKGKPLTVPCMYDLRRYCGGSAGLTNMIGFMPCTLESVGNNMAETVELVKEALKPAKEDRFTGLYSLPLLKLAYTVLPQAVAEIAIKIGYTNPYIGMSNIGIVNPDEVTFAGDLAPADAFYSGAIKFKPYMQLALTTFRNEITFSIGVRVTDSEEKIFRAFLDKVVAELGSFAEEETAL